MSFSGYRMIFPQYKIALGTNSISGDYNDKIVGYYSSDANFETTFSSNDISSTNYLNIIVEQLRKSSVTVNEFNTCLLTTNITTFNKNTNISSDYSYDEHQQIACSSRIFGDTIYQNCNSWVTNDLDYNKQDPMSVTGLKHWSAEYNFNSGYNPSEYRVYGINRTYVENDVSCLTAAYLKYRSSDLTAMRYILLGCRDNSNNIIPMIYYDLGKTYYSNKNYIEVDWHTDGLLKIQ